MSETSTQLSVELMGILDRFGKLNMAVKRRMKIKAGEFGVLFFIYSSPRARDEGITASLISDALSVSQPTVTPIISQLEASGYITKERDSADRRAYRICITPAGQEVVKKNFDALLESIHELICHLGVDDAKTLISLLEKSVDFLSSNVRRGRADAQNA